MQGLPYRCTVVDERLCGEMSRVGTRKRLEDIPLNGDCSAWPPCRSRVRLCDRENTREEKLKSELSAVSRAARWCCSSKRVQAGDHILRAGQNREERQNSCSTAAHSAFRQRSCVQIIRGMEPLLWYAVDCILVSGSEGMRTDIPREEPRWREKSGDAARQDYCRDAGRNNNSAVYFGTTDI